MPKIAGTTSVLDLGLPDATERRIKFYCLTLDDLRNIQWYDFPFNPNKIGKNTILVVLQRLHDLGHPPITHHSAAPPRLMGIPPKRRERARQYWDDRSNAEHLHHLVWRMFNGMGEDRHDVLCSYHSTFRLRVRTRKLVEEALQHLVAPKR